MTGAGKQEATRGQVIFALLSVYVIWGSTYLAMHIAVETLPPLQMAACRFLVAGALMYGWLRLRGAQAPDRKAWWSGALTGVLLLGFGNGLVAISQQWVATGLAAVMVAIMPLWAALFGGLWGEWPRWKEWLGLGLGAVGIVLLNFEGDLRGSVVGAVMLLVAPMAWALGSVWSKHLPIAKGPMASATQMLAGGAVMAVAGLVLEDVPTAPSARSLGALAYLVFFGSIVAFSAYGFLLRSVRPAVATSYAYVNPVVAIALGIAFAGEQISPIGLAGAAVVLVGVVIAVLARAQPAARAGPSAVTPVTAAASKA